MKEYENYIFISDRLGFRNWDSVDIDKMHEINSNEEVMEFFPRVPTKEETIEFVDKMKRMFLEQGFCYFAVDKLENSEFIGFIGLCKQTYKADFTPCVDIGWRIKRKEWNKGFATEGAKKCLDFALNNLKLQKVYSTAPKINTKSQRIMEKIGLKNNTNLNIHCWQIIPSLKPVCCIKLNSNNSNSGRGPLPVFR